MQNEKDRKNGTTEPIITITRTVRIRMKTSYASIAINNKVQVTYRPTWYSSTNYDQYGNYDGYQNDYEIDY